MICLHCGNEIIKSTISAYHWVHEEFGGVTCPSKSNSEIIEALMKQKKETRTLTIARPTPKSLGEL